jgi:hypothetical protein
VIDVTEGAFQRFVEALERAGVPYMLTGSHAGGYYGPGRATQDIDFVIMPSREQLQLLVDQLTYPEFYVDGRVALEALREHGQFNAIDRASALKADFIIRKSRPFSEEEFRRRTPAVVADVPVMIATAEDIIISKLEWSKLGGSTRQIEDVSNILGSRLDRLDRPYIDRWVHQLGLEQQWNAALQAVGVDSEERGTA